MGYLSTGKRAIVTGATGGIGRGIAMRLAGLGVRVVLNGRRADVLEGVASEARAMAASAGSGSSRSGDQGVTVAGDITDPRTVEALADRAVETLGGVDILVCCSGVAGPVRFEETTPERLREHMEVNYYAPVALCRRVLPLMRAQGEGYIVNVASLAGLKGLPTYVSNGASKAALIGFSDALRHEVAQDGITVSVLCVPRVSAPRWSPGPGMITQPGSSGSVCSRWTRWWTA